MYIVPFPLKLLIVVEEVDYFSVMRQNGRVILLATCSLWEKPQKFWAEKHFNVCHL